MEVDRGHIPERLMRSVEVVLHKPVSEFGIETGAISSEVAHLNKLFSEGTIESFINGVVGWSFGTGEVVREFEGLSSDTEVLCEFRSIVSLNVFDFSGKEVVQTFEEVGGMTGMFGSIHASECDF